LLKISFLITWINVVYHHRNVFAPRFYIRNYPRNEGKGTVVPVHAMVAYSGSRGIALLIFYLGIRWRWVVIFKYGHCIICIHCI